MINKNLVLLSYGKDSEYFRAIFCILSFVSWYEDHLNETRINVYTDNPDFFKQYLSHISIEYILLTPALMTNMLADTTYFHRRKVSVIDMTFKQFPGENLIFIDSDTFFISGYNPLLDNDDPKKSFMHRLEYTLGEALEFFTAFGQEEHPKAFMEYISNRQFHIQGKKEQFGPNDNCWNSGVLGLHNSFAKYLPDVFQLTDDFYANSKWFISEQLAFGLIIQRQSEIQPVESFVVHYWGKRQKELFDLLIEKFLTKTSAKDLANKSFIRVQTKKWNKAFEIDVILQQAEIAISQKDWKTITKKIIKLIFRYPFNEKTYKGLYAALNASN